MSVTRVNPEVTVESWTSKPSWLTITAKSGWTIAADEVKRYGNAVYVRGFMKSASAISANANLSPFNTNVKPAILVSDVLYGYVASPGDAWITVDRERNANTNIGFTMIGVMA